MSEAEAKPRSRLAQCQAEASFLLVALPSGRIPSAAAGRTGVGMEGDEASAAVDFVAGTVGGIASLLAGHPFDTIKTRLQAQSHSTSVIPTPSSSSPLLAQQIPSFRYTSAWDALRRIVAEERFVGLYKGVTSPMLGVAVMNASIFGVYGMALRKLQGEDDQRASLPAIFLAGCLSGIVSA